MRVFVVEAIDVLFGQFAKRMVFYVETDITLASSSFGCI